MSFTPSKHGAEKILPEDWKDMSRYKRKFGYLIPISLSYVVTILVFAVNLSLFLSIKEVAGYGGYLQNLVTVFLLLLFFGSMIILPIYLIFCTFALYKSRIENSSSLRNMTIWGMILGAGVGALFGPMVDMKGVPLIFLAAIFGALAGSVGGYTAAWLHNRRPIIQRKV